MLCVIEVIVWNPSEIESNSIQYRQHFVYEISSLIVYNIQDERGDHEEHGYFEHLSSHFLDRFIQFSNPEHGI
jgi:hypothetical protein